MKELSLRFVSYKGFKSPAGIWLFKVRIGTPEQYVKHFQSSTLFYLRCPVVFIVNFEQISHIVLMFLLLTMSMRMMNDGHFQLAFPLERMMKVFDR